VKLLAAQLAQEPDARPGRNGEMIDGENAFEEATNVMESGLLRTLTDRSARPTGQVEVVAVPPPPAPPPAPAATKPPQAPPPLPPLVQPKGDERAASTPVAPRVAPSTRRSRVFVIAGVVAAIVLMFDAWLLSHHRPATKPAAVAPSAAATPLPKYMLVPLDSPPPAAAPPSTTPAAAPTKMVVAEESGSATSAPTTRKHHHSHHRHSTP
jgi:hypothetical protein